MPVFNATIAILHIGIVLLIKRLSKTDLSKSLLQLRPALRYVLIFTASINLLYLAPSIYMLEVYDRVLTSSNLSTLLFLTLIVLFLFLIMQMLEYVRTAMVIKVGEKFDNALNQKIYTAAFHQNLKSNKINAGQALADLTTIRQFLTGNGLFAFYDAPWFPIYLAVIFLFNFWMGIFATVCVLIIVALAWANSQATHLPLKEANSYAVQSGAIATNGLRHAETIQAMGMVSAIRARWLKLHLKFLNSQSDGSMRSGYISAVSKFFRLAMQSLILGLGAYLAIQHEISAGMMIAGSILLGRALAPVDLLISVWRQWGGVVSAYGRLNQLLEENPENSHPLSLPKPAGTITVENVVVQFEGTEQAALKGVDFQIEAGECVALVGLSGAGKTTLGKLLVGVIKPNSGNVRIDSADYSSWNLDELGKHIGYVPQQPTLFAGTIAENIARFGAIDSEEIVRTAQLVGVHEFILHLPKGYETTVGDGGQGLSGGQIQRIALTQALYGDPALIVLDEPDSNLDQSGELSLIETLRQLKQNKKTVVFISHNPQFIQHSDKLLFLENGSIKFFEPSNVAIQRLMARAAV